MNLNARTITLFFFGLASAIPLAMCGTTLTVRLTELGVTKTLIGLFGLLHLPYSCRMLWGPIIDYRPSPLLAFLGWRKGWTIFSLLSAAASVGLLGWVDPTHSLTTFLVLLGIASLATGCVYMAGLAYELESLDQAEYPMGSACINAGYRSGLLTAGAVALFVAAAFDWTTSYLFAATVMLAGTLVIWWQPEPFKSADLLKERLASKKNWLQIFYHGLVDPVLNFWNRTDKWSILSFIFLYKLGDDLAHSYLPVFYLETGFSKADIALIVKLFGMGATFVGVFVGGFTAQRWGVTSSLLFFGALHGLSYAFYTLLYAFPSTELLSLAVVIEHATSGMVITVFIAFLWKLTESRYAPMQYALFWSLLSCKHVIFSMLGGWLADQVSWPFFFGITTLLFIPGMLLLVSLEHAQRKLSSKF